MSRTPVDRPKTPAPPVSSRTSPRLRRTQAERSETTRQKLIEATVKLLRARGYEGLRTVEISEVAGVSRGAQMHHFPTTDTLVAATVEHLNQRMLDRTRNAIAAARRGGDPITELIKDACDFFFGDYFFITLALNTVDSRNRALATVAKSLMVPGRFSVERDWQTALEASGLPKRLAEEVLILTLSMVRGFGVRTLLVGQDDRFSKELGLWRRIIDEHIASQPWERAPKSRANRAVAGSTAQAAGRNNTGTRRARTLA